MAKSGKKGRNRRARRRVKETHSAEAGAVVKEAPRAKQAPGKTPAAGSQGRVANELSMSVQKTCCSNCRTVFEVPIDLLVSPDTRVRCGECLSIFDALGNLLEVSKNEALPASQHRRVSVARGRTDEAAYLADNLKPTAVKSRKVRLAASSLDVTYSDSDLFSEDAGLPEVIYFGSEDDIDDLDFADLADNDQAQKLNESLLVGNEAMDARSSVGQSGFSDKTDSLAVQGALDFLTSDVPNEPLVFNYREREEVHTAEDSISDAIAAAKRVLRSDFATASVFDGELEAKSKGQSQWAVRSLLLVLVLVLAGGLYSYRERDQLLAQPGLRSMMSRACDVLGCTLGPLVNLDALRAVSRTVTSHPTLSDVLIIRFGVVNDAAIAQPYPVLEIRLTDRAGRLVVTNSFTPYEYARGWSVDDQLEPGGRLDISLSVQDPGNTAMSFELDFRRMR